MFESFFVFDGKFYEQCDGVEMGSPLEPTLANVFMHLVGKLSCSFQTNCLHTIC